RKSRVPDTPPRLALRLRASRKSSGTEPCWTRSRNPPPNFARLIVVTRSYGHWRIAALRLCRLATLRFGWFAACSGAPSHRLPQGSGLGIVPVQTSTLEAAGGRSCASQQILTANVRFGSKADIGARPHNVCFTPESGHH